MGASQKSSTSIIRLEARNHESRQGRIMNKLNLKSFALGVSVAISALGIYALALSIPNTFSAGTSISSGQVNANFAAVKTAVDALEAKFPVSAANLAALPAVTAANLQNGWAADALYGSNPPSFYKDLQGIVHLQGAVQGGTGETVFTLPTGFRPTGTLWLRVYTYGNTNGTLRINPEGTVLSLGSGSSIQYTSLENITFRAAPYISSHSNLKHSDLTLTVIKTF
jgi:hypothetical protein